MTGSYITHDGGHSWRMFNLRGTTKFFAFDPLAPHTIYAETIGLWRSTDDGVSWRLIYPPTSAVQGVEMSSDHADEKILARPNPVGTITGLAIDPADSRTLYAAGGGKGSPALFISRNYGDSWQKLADLPEVPRHLWIDPYSPRRSRTVVIAGAHFVMTRERNRQSQIPAAGLSHDNGFVGRLFRPWKICSLCHVGSGWIRLKRRRHILARHCVARYRSESAGDRDEPASSGDSLHLL